MPQGLPPQPVPPHSAPYPPASAPPPPPSLNEPLRLCLLCVLPSTCQGLAQGHCSNSIPPRPGLPLPPLAAGFLFHSLLFLGILCSIKPWACNTAGRAPSCLSRSFVPSFLPFLLPPFRALWGSPCPLFLRTLSLLTLGEGSPGTSQRLLIHPLPQLWQRCAEKAPPIPPLEGESRQGCRLRAASCGAPPRTPGWAAAPGKPGSGRAAGGVRMPDWFCWFLRPALGGPCTQGGLWRTIISHLDSCHPPAHWLGR